MGGIDRDTLRAVQSLIRPLANRITRSIARGVVRVVNDATKMQLLQVSDFPGGPASGVEHFQPYGFASVPLEGAEAMLAFLNGGDLSHPIAIAVTDRRYRPKGKEPGEVTMYNNAGASLTMTKDGDIIGEPAPGRSFLVRAPGGTAVELPTKADVQALRNYVNNQFSATTGHVHAVAGAATTTIAAVAATPVLTGPAAPTVIPASPTGTTVLKAE